MNVLIIEDEKPAARRLWRMLERINVNGTEMLHSVEEAVAWCSSNPQPELIFLDRQLSDGLSFEIFDAIDIKSSGCGLLENHATASSTECSISVTLTLILSSIRESLLAAGFSSSMMSTFIYLNFDGCCSSEK